MVRIPSTCVRSISRKAGYVVALDRYDIISYVGICIDEPPGMVGREETVIVSGS